MDYMSEGINQLKMADETQDVNAAIAFFANELLNGKYKLDARRELIALFVYGVSGLDKPRIESPLTAETLALLSKCEILTDRNWARRWEQFEYVSYRAWENSL